MKRAVAALALFLAVTAYILFIPGLVGPAIGPGGSNVQRQDMGKPVGIVRIWYIAQFRPYSGSGAQWLSLQAKETEKRIYGLFFDVEAMSVDEYTERTLTGERADIYAFPAGVVLSEQLQGVSARDTLYAKAGEYMGETLGVVLFASSYAIIENMGMRTGDAASSTADIKIAAFAAGDCVPLAEAGFTGELMTKEDFISGKCPLYLGDLRTVSELEIYRQRGTGFASGAYPANGYGSVQLLGVDSETGAEKKQAAEWLIDRLLQDKAQKKLVGMGLLPINEQLLDKQALPAAVSELCAYPENVYNAFLYAAEKEKLETLAMASIAGDKGAKSELESLISGLYEAAK